MIYLLITTSINNRFGQQNADERKQRYLYAISETLKHLPYEIKPIIVENNGKRETYLDNFYHHHNQHVKVIYTDNNKLQFKSKGANELVDIKEVIERYGIDDEDIVIKLTGRYRALSSKFFDDVIENVDSYALRAKYINLFNQYSIDNYKSAEIAFARYVRFCGARLKEINQLDIECSFAEDSRLLVV
jgi:hypothetical protein